MFWAVWNEKLKGNSTLYMFLCVGMVSCAGLNQLLGNALRCGALLEVCKTVLEVMVIKVWFEDECLKYWTWTRRYQVHWTMDCLQSPNSSVKTTWVSPGAQMQRCNSSVQVFGLPGSGKTQFCLYLGDTKAVDWHSISRAYYWIYLNLHEFAIESLSNISSILFAKVSLMGWCLAIFPFSPSGSCSGSCVQQCRFLATTWA